MIRQETYYRIALLWCVVVALCCKDVLAQNTGADGRLNLQYAYASFVYDDSLSFVDFSYQFSDAALTYMPGDNDEHAEVAMRLILVDSSGTALPHIDWATANVRSGNDRGVKTLLGTRALALFPGSYDATLYCQDRYNESFRDSVSFTMRVRSYKGGTIALSDIQYVSDRAPSDDRNHPFYRSGYILLPNVPGVVAPPNLALNTYVEVYNADRTPTSQYTISYVIADTTGRGIYREDKRLDRPDASAIIDMHSIPLVKLESGSFYIMIRVFNGIRKTATDSFEVIRPFTVYNPKQDSILNKMLTDVTVPLDIVDPTFAGLKESELDFEFKKASFIASEPEKYTWEQLTGIEAKGRFLTRFWGKKDDTPQTPANEFKELYEKRLKKAAALYTTGMAPNGWDSDRGRVLLQYGEPDGMDRHPNDYNRKPYEIWTYTNLSYQFVFVDRGQTGLYTLVHSTAPGEVSYANWEGEYAAMHKYLHDGEFDQQGFGSGN